MSRIFQGTTPLSGSGADFVEHFSHSKVMAHFILLSIYVLMRKLQQVAVTLVLSAFFLPIVSLASNTVMGEIHFVGRSNVERTSGVWVDGQYVGYLKELTGSKKVMLLPGKHTIVVRQDGYKDFTDEVTLQPGEKQDISVAMEKTVVGPRSQVNSTVTISANPSRAAVFVDGLYVGHVHEFRGWGRAMLVAPGAHRIRIALPGYETFEADINPKPDQKVEIKTDLMKSAVPLSDPLLAPGTSNTASSPKELPSAAASPTEK